MSDQCVAEMPWDLVRCIRVELRYAAGRLLPQRRVIRAGRNQVTLRVVLLASAEQDLKELKGYIVRNFGANVWQDSSREIKECIAALKLFPMAGSILDELRKLQILRYLKRYLAVIELSTNSAKTPSTSTSFATPERTCGRC